MTIDLSGSFSWSEPIVVAEPPGTTSAFPVYAGVRLFGVNNSGDDGSSAEIDAAPNTWTVTAPVSGFYETVAISGSFSDSPALYLDPADPQDLAALPFGYVDYSTCAGFCQVLDDTFGNLSGTLTTTFKYRPAEAPEPSGWSGMAAGLLILAAAKIRRAA